MADSLLHLRLVRLVIEHVERVYTVSHQVAVFHDLPGLLGCDKPPRIDGFVPDVYAVDAPTSIVILGEAKTEPDLLTDHSRRQLEAFLRYLGHQERSVFLLAVPWQASATARNLMSKLQRDLGVDNVDVSVIDDISG